MKLFPHNSAMTNNQKTFNYQLSRARIVVENAFGQLKARWRRLLRQNNMDIARVPRVVTACCILHNMCEVHGDAFVDSWLEGARLEQPGCAATPVITSAHSRDIRDTLVQYFM